jgi:hypothetical protein
MHTVLSKIVVCGGLFLLSMISGGLLSHAGRPLNTLLFAIHKLAALATIIVVIINVVQLQKTVDMQTLVVWTAIIAAGLLFLALFVSGALMSFEKPFPQFILRIHQVTPLLALVASAATFYLLINKS